jgi:hypothetical protein
MYRYVTYLIHFKVVKHKKFINDKVILFIVKMKRIIQLDDLRFVNPEETSLFDANGNRIYRRVDREGNVITHNGKNVLRFEARDGSEQVILSSDGNPIMSKHTRIGDFIYEQRLDGERQIAFVSNDGYQATETTQRGRMSNIADYLTATNFGRVVRTAAGVVFGLMAGMQAANADIIDDLFQQGHTPKWWFENPYSNGGLNPIVGIDGNGAGEYALVWADGGVARYHEGAQGTDHFAVFGTGLNAAALAYVMPGAGISGDIAVADVSGFASYSLDGTPIDGYNVSGSDILDMDINLGQVWLGGDDFFGYRNPDGSVHSLDGSRYDACEVIDFDGYNDALLSSSSGSSGVNRFNPDLTLQPGYNTDYYSHQGFALTENDLLVVASDHVFAFDNPYSPYIADNATPTPEPGSLGMLLAGAAFVLAGNRFKKEKELYVPRE